MKAQKPDLLRRINARIPLWMAGLYMPLVQFIRRLKALRLFLYILEGKERDSGEPLRIAYFTEDERILSYWKNLLFKDECQQRKKGRMPVWRLNTYTQSNEDSCDLMLAELNRLSSLFTSTHLGFLLPRWLLTHLDVENTLQALCKYDSPRLIRKHGFTMEERSSEADLRFFYERMFTPYIQSRHKDASVMVDYSYFLKRFRKKDSRLFFLMHDHTPVAASFNERKNGMIKFSGVGVLDASLEYFKMGCIRVLYYFMMVQYDKEQIDTIHFGGTSAILSDGLTQFKNTLRAFPAPDDHFKDGTIWLAPLTRTVTLKKVLGSNPFVLVDKGQCYRAVFMASTDFQKKKQFLSFLKRYRLRKLAGTKIFCWDDPDKFQDWIEEEKLDDHQLIPIGEATDYSPFP